MEMLGLIHFSNYCMHIARLEDFKLFFNEVEKTGAFSIKCRCAVHCKCSWCSLFCLLYLGIYESFLPTNCIKIINVGFLAFYCPFGKVYEKLCCRLLATTVMFRDHY